MKQIATAIFIAGLTGLSVPVFSFPAAMADTADAQINMKLISPAQQTIHPTFSGFDQRISANKENATHVFSVFGDSNLSRAIDIAAAETGTGNKSTSQPAIQGNEIQDERIEFEEEATRIEFGDETNREEFKEQAIRREFGGQTKFAEPVPKAENHDR